MPADLEAPSSPDDLYLARGDEVEVFRPWMQGDVLYGLDIPGVGDEEGDPDRLAMIMTHPCSMRQGARLVPRLLVLRVRRWERPIPLASWSRGFFRLMPLPSLFQEPTEGVHAAVFDTMGRIRSDELKHDRRIACLSHDGLALLQQRFVHNLTRVVVDKPTLLDSMVHVLEEADLQEEWARDLLEGVPSGAMVEALDREVARFDEFLGAKREDGETLRDDLRNPGLRASVRRAVRAEIRRRKGEDSS